MAFWSDPSELLPKQAHRWVATFGDNRSQTSVSHYFFKSIDRPSYEIGSIQAKYLYSHTFNFPKRAIWKPIKAEFYDVLITTGGEIIGTAVHKDIKMFDGKTGVGEKIAYRKSAQMFFYTLLQKAGYFNPHGSTKESTLTFKSYTFKDNLSLALMGNKIELIDTETQNNDEFKWYVKFEELDDEGEVTERWILYNPFVTSVNFNKLDYSSDNVVTITADISYDWAELDSDKVFDGPDKPKTNPYQETKKEPIETKDPVFSTISSTAKGMQSGTSLTTISGEATQDENGIWRPGSDDKGLNIGR